MIARYETWLIILKSYQGVQQEECRQDNRGGPSCSARRVYNNKRIITNMGHINKKNLLLTKSGVGYGRQKLFIR